MRRAGVLRVLARVWVAVAVVVAGSSACAQEQEVAPTRVAEGAAFPIHAATAVLSSSELLLTVQGCSEDATSSVEERPDQIKVTLHGPRAPAPCDPEQVVVQLRAPVGDRRLIDATTGGEVAITAVEPTPTTASTATDCTRPSMEAAVAREVGPGLHAHLLSCGGDWLVANTAPIACAADRESADCAPTHHVVYFHKVERVWRRVATDSCAGLGDLGMPEMYCQSG